MRFSEHFNGGRGGDGIAGARLRRQHRRVGSAILMMLSAWPAISQTRQTTPPSFTYNLQEEGWLKPGGGVDTAAILMRYSADRKTFDRYYDVYSSNEGISARDAFNTSWMSLLEKVPYESLDVEGQIDYLLLRNTLERNRLQSAAHKKRTGEIAELVPFAGTILALDDDLRRLVFVDGGDAASRMTKLADQIARLAVAVNSGKLTGTPNSGARAGQTTLALRDTLRHWFDFYNGYDPDFTWWVNEPWKRADAALAAYALLLREKIAGIGTSDRDSVLGDPVGRQAIEEGLRGEMIPYTPQEMIDFARQEFSWCRKQMIANAGKMGFGDDWRKALESVKNDYVKPGKQPALVRDLATEAVDFVREHDLITVPEGARNTWRMQMMTPERQRINPFFSGGDVMSVSYPTATMTQEQKIMSLRGNNVHFARATVFHELIPGHYLQQYMSQRFRPWRADFQTPFWGEGWAFYWEMLLWDLDFARSPADRIGMLFWRMHRAARVIFSLRFHLGEITAGQAVEFLVDEVGHERENAVAEVRRSFEGEDGSLYQCAYEIGAMQFRALHAELVDSGKMTNRQFHDAVLKLNSMPVEMVRASLLNQKMPKDFMSHWRFLNGITAVNRDPDAATDAKVSTR